MPPKVQTSLFSFFNKSKESLSSTASSFPLNTTISVPQAKVDGIVAEFESSSKEQLTCESIRKRSSSSGGKSSKKIRRIITESEEEESSEDQLSSDHSSYSHSESEMILDSEDDREQVDTIPKIITKRKISKDERQLSSVLIQEDVESISHEKIFTKLPVKVIETGKYLSPSAIFLPEGVFGIGSHEHNSWEWLKPSHRKDKFGKKNTAPDYDPKTLFVPESFLRLQTPAMQQWWDLKMNNMDTVLFFKVGKFYELFHMDADVGMTELDLIYMKGSKAHSGFPEVSYGKFASILVSKGYRVARVEQTETPDMLKERNDSVGKGKKDKVVARELCSIISKGTRTYCHLDDLSLLDNPTAGSSSLLVCIKEMASPGKIVEYGICCIDTVVSKIVLAQFEDDCLRTRLRSFLYNYFPSEVILEKLHYSEETMGVIKLVAPTASVEYLRDDEFPNEINVVIESIKSAQYFLRDSKEDDFSKWPCVLKAVIDGLFDGSSELALLAFGGAIWQLRRSKIDFEIISMGNVSAYIPNDEAITEVDSEGLSCNDQRSSTPKIMIVDAIALSNLEILKNNFDGSPKGSLWHFLNHCRTLFGQRLLKEWVLHPLFRPEDISKRANAIDELMSSACIQANVARKVLSEIPDLERLLSCVHSCGIPKKGINHPDSRAIMYEEPIYNSRKIKIFVDILSGFNRLLDLEAPFESITIGSGLLKNVVKSTINGGHFPFPEMRRLLSYFREIFDEKQAKKDGSIKPKPGVDSEFDKLKLEVASLEAFFENYLRELKSLSGIHDLKYWGANKDRYQIEVPMSSVKKVPDDWVTKSQKKTHRRYWTSSIEAKLEELSCAETKLEYLQNDTLRRVFEKFDSNKQVWKAALTCSSILDALLSLADVSTAPDYVWPDILSVDHRDSPVISISGGRHPMLDSTFRQRSDCSYIPNNIQLGGNVDFNEISPKLLLLSGPNMGGKSTLLRQTCLITIMAQLGCKVPAQSCRLSPVDRIFTRVGASDRILSGMSTFFVELAETAAILQASTQHSLCIIDELGRGTATFDGTAIAHAVINHLVNRTCCRVLFATHYHSLVKSWDMDPRVQLAYMDCLVSDDSDTTSGNVLFLYKLCNGSSKRSYGINVAKLANLPDEVLQMAKVHSEHFEEKSTKSKVMVGTIENFIIFYDRLVSLVSCKMHVQEIYFVVVELWKRFHRLN